VKTDQLYRVEIDGGWREVEVVPETYRNGTVMVRDVLRGEYMKVLADDLVPVVTHSQWETPE